jgi:hypothetical protein
MSIFGKSDAAAASFLKKSQSQYFPLKKCFVSMSATTVFFRVVSKVSGAIDKMDIYNMSIFWMFLAY